jgi:hypothetical protein
MLGTYVRTGTLGLNSEMNSKKVFSIVKVTYGYGRLVLQSPCVRWTSERVSTYAVGV